MKIIAAFSAAIALAQASSGGKSRQNGGDKTNGVDSMPHFNNGGVNNHAYSPEIRDYIVQKHNWARVHLVPSEACNMRQVKWDESLAIEAAELVETCVFAHDTENYGQNLMYGGNKLDKKTVDSWIDSWVRDEITDSDRQGTGYMELNHASAVLWADTHLVGCASKICPNGYLTACNYFNPGNWRGERAYVPGKSCSKCPSQAPYCDVSGKLCTASPDGKPTPGYSPTPVPSGYGPAPTPASQNGSVPAHVTTAVPPSNGSAIAVPTPCPSTPHPAPTTLAPASSPSEKPRCT